MVVDTLDLARLDALLHAPDPPDLPRRAHVLKYPGDVARRQTIMLPLLVRWLQTRYVMVECNDYILKI